MIFLLDTHSFLWFITGNPRLSVFARSLINEPNNTPVLSIASLWEMAIKVSLGKLHLHQPFDELIRGQLQLNGIELLAITPDHVIQVSRLPFHHRDPFDRLMIAQAIVEDLPFLSVDAAFDSYAIQRLWS